MENDHMALYLIGDLQGCNEPLQRLLQKLDFSPSTDTLYLLGDLVNRGPDSLGVLRRLSALGDSAQCLLGNHDMHALAVSCGVRSTKRGDTLQPWLDADDHAALFDWLRHRPMALHAHGWLMVHAGVLPQWTTAQTIALAAEVEQVLRGPNIKAHLTAMYGNTPAAWHNQLAGPERLRVIINALTRLRFCTAEGLMDFTSNGGPDSSPDGFLPWFDVPGRATLDQPIGFGHWSALMPDKRGPSRMHNKTLPLDTGCVWGGCLTAAKLGSAPGEFELIQVDCEQAQEPTC
jgi:bis(5'-nucleosyl)-tetraphosphatase (symmetrical)